MGSLREELDSFDAMRALFPAGTHRFTDNIESDGLGNGPFEIRLAMEVTPDRIVLDATDTDDSRLNTRGSAVASTMWRSSC